MTSERKSLSLVRSILLVDDEVEFANSLARKLEDFGYYVRSVPFESARLAEFVEAGGAADVAIVDWKLLSSHDEGRMANLMIEELFSSGVVGVAVCTGVDLEVVKSELDSSLSERVEVIPKSLSGSGVDDELVESITDFISKVEDYNTMPAVSTALYHRRLFRDALNSVVSQVCGWKEDTFEVLSMMFKADNEEYGRALASYFTDLVHDEALVRLADGDPSMDQILKNRAESCATALKKSKSVVAKEPQRIETWREIRQNRFYDSRNAPTPSRARLGDIFEASPEGETPFRLVITPRCEISHPSESEPVWTVLKGEAETNSDRMKSAMLRRSSRYLVLVDVPIHGERTSKHLHFRFADSAMVTSNDIEKWRWLARVREPFIDDIVQSYAKYYLRIGVPGDPWDDKQWSEVCKYLCGSQS